VWEASPCHHLRPNAIYCNAFFSSFSIITALNCEQLLIELEGRTPTQTHSCGNVVKGKGFHVARQQKADFHDITKNVYETLALVE